MQLDYTLTTPEERIECVNRLLAETPDEKLTPQYLSYMSNYILFTQDRNQTKKEKKSEYPTLTKNREVTINKRQVSFEEIISNLENGEDGLYAMINNDKNQILDPKDPITEEEIAVIPGMRGLMDTIDSLQKQFEKAKGSARYILKRSIIETWQQAYLLKASWKGNNGKMKSSQLKTLAKLNIEENIQFNKEGMPVSTAILSLLNPEYISFLLCYYSKLKEECWDDLQCDMHWLLVDLENLTEKVLVEDYPLLYDLVIWKIDGLTNEQIQVEMDHKYGEWHSEQYYSSLWRKRIPRLLSEQAQKDYLIWYYTNVEKGYWKKCTKCGEIKLGHPAFFSKNSSKDGFYSQCKDCKNGKTKKK